MSTRANRKIWQPQSSSLILGSSGDPCSVSQTTLAVRDNGNARRAETPLSAPDPNPTGPANSSQPLPTTWTTARSEPHRHVLANTPRMHRVYSRFKTFSKSDEQKCQIIRSRLHSKSARPVCYDWISVAHRINSPGWIVYCQFPDTSQMMPWLQKLSYLFHLFPL